MNKGRRTEIRGVIAELELIIEKIDGIKCDEEEYKDNMPENMQGSEKYEKAEEVVDSLDGAIGEIETMIEDMQSACE